MAILVHGQVYAVVTLFAISLPAQQIQYTQGHRLLQKKRVTCM